MEAKTIFKEKDVVYVIPFGWGIVIGAKKSSPEGYVGIELNSGRIIHVDTYLVSFTEYTLDGFSHERPEGLPNVGDIVWVRNEFPSEWKVGHFFKKLEELYYVSASPNTNGWSHRGTEIRTTNPYANEQ